jgi:hypothetical protein
MIPQHILDDLGPDDRMTVLTRDGELHFLVHTAAANPDELRAQATREGSEVVATHLRDENEILALVAGRERDVGGES